MSQHADPGYNPEMALENLKILKARLEEWRQESFSEADTRSKIIDFAFMNVLGWTEFDVWREGWSGAGWYDYEFRTPECRFIVEAKKGMEEFKLPAVGRTSTIKFLKKGNSDLIEQVRRYVVRRNTQWGVATNGSQFIVGQFVNVDGRDWTENDCTVFRSLDDVEENFVEFANLLSRPAVIERRHLRPRDLKRKARTILQYHATEREREVIRNDFSAQLGAIVQRVFGEIAETENLNDYELLRQCYVKTEDARKEFGDLNALFADVPPSFDTRIASVQNTDNMATQIRSQVTSDAPTLPDTVVVIGGKGAGKTTFLKHFTEVVLTDGDKKNRPVLYIDFRRYTRQQVEDTRRIHEDVLDLLYEEYPKLKLTDFNILKTIYKKQINRNRVGIWQPYVKDEDELDRRIGDFFAERQADPERHLIAISEYLVGTTRKRLVVVFDNADQLDEDAQREVFLLASSFRSTVKAAVFISLREGYFRTWRRKAPFDAFSLRVFHVTAPPFGEVLRRRIEYVLDRFDFPSVDAYTDGLRVKATPEKTREFFRNVERTLFAGENSEVLRFLEETTYPDLRQGLERFRDFLLSGHTKVDEYAAVDYRQIPIWEFIKAVALGSRVYYDEQYSTIVNLFRPVGGSRSHFNKIRLLDFLNERLEDGGQDEGYMGVGEIEDVFYKYGRDRATVHAELEVLLDARLVEASDLRSDVASGLQLAHDDRVRISRAGRYYLLEILSRFRYLDLVLQDTPIFDETVYEQMCQRFPWADGEGKRSIQRRRGVVLDFLDYLQSREEAEELPRGGTAGVPVPFRRHIVRDKLRVGVGPELDRIKAQMDAARNGA